MCASAKGAPICKDMRIVKFAPVAATLFGETQKRYDK